MDEVGDILDEAGDPLACVSRAEVHSKMGDYRKAVEMTIRAARLAQAAGDFKGESTHWAEAATMAYLHLKDHQATVMYVISSTEAAFRVEDAQVQADLLADATPFLNRCLQAFEMPGVSLEDVYEETGQTEGTEGNAATEKLRSLNFTKAEAYFVLGSSQLMFKSSVDEASECYTHGANLLTGQLNAREEGLMFMIQFAHASIFRNAGELEKAMELYSASKLVAPSQRLKMKSETGIIHCIKARGEYQRATEMLTRLIRDNESLLAEEPDVKARLLLELGQSLAGIGNFTKAIINLEAARELYETKVLPSAAAGWLPWTYVCLSVVYMEQQQFFRAFDLTSKIASMFDSESEYSRALLDTVKILNATSFNLVADHETARAKLTETFESKGDELPWDEKSTLLLGLGNAYRKLGDLESALDKYAEVMACINEVPRTAFVLEMVASVRLNQAVVYKNKAADAKTLGEDDAVEENCMKALNLFHEAAEILEKLGQCPLELARANLGQATIYILLTRYEEAEFMLDKSAHYENMNDLVAAKFHWLRSEVRASKGDVNGAEISLREGVVRFAEAQAMLKGQEDAWITFLEGEMAASYVSFQELLVTNKRYTDALLWAERSRMRLYFYLVNGTDSTPEEDQQPQAYTDPLLFDKDDEHATNCILDTVRNCAAGTTILEYTHDSTQNFLYIYVVQQTGPVVAVHLRLNEFFSSNQRAKLGKTVEALVRRTRTAIIKDTGHAKVGLGILHELLFEPVQELLTSCSTVIFVPHGALSLVPFAALYDAARTRFLIQDKAVGVVPSIRGLARCFMRQKKIQSSPSDPPFIAGNPEPMGLGCKQLPGASREASQVAEQFGVAPLLGSDVTKEAVLQNLGKASVVLLATHGIVNSIFPHGALVIQSSNASTRCMEPTHPAAAFLAGAAAEMVSKGEEVVTAKEIERLPGGVGAALVVLSACQTGDGKVSSEGLLGLGRSVLQAGCACVVITLWKVDDAVTPELVGGMFEDLLEHKNVVDGLRNSMLRMIDGGKPIYKWAPLVAFGSPTLHL